MKTFLAILLAAGVGFAAAYVYVSNSKTAEFNQQQAALKAQWEAELAKSESDLKAARNKSPRVEKTTATAEIPATAKASAKEILERLIAMKPAANAERYHSIRQIIHQLESLSDLGNEALADIRTFLAQNKDVSYERARESDNANGANPAGPAPRNNRVDFSTLVNANNGLPRTDNYYPYSLRLGLFDVLKQIGSPQAEGLLAEVLSSTGRGVEVAHITQLLEDLAPGKYRDLAIAAASDLLKNPIPIPNPTRLDEDSERYLYAILLKYNDTTFTAIAQQKLVGADGQLDRNALTYLSKALRDQVMPTVYQAYKDPRVTNQTDRASLLAIGANYFGSNLQANELFKDVVADDANSFGRFLAISSLAGGGFGPIQRDSPTDPQIIQARIALLNDVKATLAAKGDDRLSGLVDRTAQNLQNLLDGKPLDPSLSNRRNPPAGQ